MDVDSDYEFNAPRYIDFLSKEPENDNPDAWFDENPDGHEGGISISELPFITQHSNFQAATRAISAALSGEPIMEKAAVLTENEDCNMTTEEHEEVDKSQPSNAESTLTKQCMDVKQEINVTEIKQEQNLVADENYVAKIKNIMDVKAVEDVKIKTKKEEKPSKRVTRSDSLKQEQTPQPNLRKRKVPYSPGKLSNKKKLQEGKGDETVIDAKKAKFELKKSLITMPSTPAFLKRLRGKPTKKAQTSEALEIEKMKKLQEETKKRLEENESHLKKVLAPQPTYKKKLATEATKTIEFSFATDSRIKQHPMERRTNSSDNGTFVSQLRKHPPSPNFKNKKPTKPMPFHFSSLTQKQMKQDNSGQWKAVAAAVNDFQNKTPERWRSRPANQQNVGPQLDEKSKAKMEITLAKTPQLMTKGRKRTSGAISQSDLEAKVVEEMTSYKFKASKFDHKIVDKGGMYGVDKLKRLPITESKPFSFNSDDRLVHRKKHEEEKKEKEREQQLQKEKPNEKRNTSIESCGGKKRPKLTELKPFSFENRDKQKLQKKNEKIQKVFEKEEKAREFHARPLPNLSPDLIPVKSGKHTEVAAFNLATDERGAIRMEKWTSQITKELEEEKERKTFKAQPCTVIHKDAFKPKSSDRPLVDVSEFKLNTEKRSKDREEFEMTIKEQQRMKEDEMQLVLKERKETEEREVALLRKQATHKANPIRNYGDFEIKPSSQAATLPCTPNFETNKRFGKMSRV